MNVIEALNARYSARGYKPDHVSKEIIENILAAAMRAPSATNTQPWEIYVASGEPLEKLRGAFRARQEANVPGNPDIRLTGWPSAIEERVKTAGRSPGRPRPEYARPSGIPNTGLFGAPVVLYLACNWNYSAYSVFDLGLIAQSIMLAAKEFSLDTVPAGSLVSYPDLVRQEVRIPDDLLLVIGIALGYASDEAAARPRRDRRTLAEAVHFVGI